METHRYDKKFPIVSKNPIKTQNVSDTFWTRSKEEYGNQIPKSASRPIHRNCKRLSVLPVDLVFYRTLYLCRIDPLEVKRDRNPAIPTHLRADSRLHRA